MCALHEWKLNEEFVISLHIRRQTVAKEIRDCNKGAGR